MKIIKTADSEELYDWDLRKVEELGAEYFVYNYQSGSYDGTGWAIWKIDDDKFGYTYLGHCSCNGPVEDLNSIPYSLSEIKEIADKHYSDHSDSVLQMVDALES